MPRPQRRSQAARDRATHYPVHPTGRARRRWPRAYDGGLPAEEAVTRRYRRAYDGDLRADRARNPRSSSMDRLRQSPIRNGLIGLAVAGTAAPIVVNRYQQALRTDPSHERLTAAPSAAASGSDDALSHVWQELEEAENATGVARDTIIQEKLDAYADFGLSRDLAEEIYDVALENDIDPDMAFGLVRAESSFKNSSTSPVGAVGLTQLMPRTADWLEPGVTRQQLRDPATNLRIGFKYLRQLVDKYDGNSSLALLAYNRGPGTVDRELKRGRNPDNGYADFVFGKADHGHKLYTSR